LFHDNLLTVDAYVSVMQRLQFLLPTWLPPNVLIEQALPLWNLILERITTIARTLQRNHYPNKTPQSCHSLVVALTVMSTIAINARDFFSKNLLDGRYNHCSELVFLCEVSIEKFLAQNSQDPSLSQDSHLANSRHTAAALPPSSEVLPHSDNGCQFIQDSIDSLCSDDVPMLHGHQQSVDDALSTTLEFAKHIFIIATKRLNSITRESQPIALLQLQTLLLSLDACTVHLSKYHDSILEMPVKYQLSLVCLAKNLRKISFLHDEMKSLIELVSSSAFSAAPPISKSGKTSSASKKTFTRKALESPLFPSKICDRVFQQLLQMSQSIADHATDAHQTAEIEFLLSQTDPIANGGADSDHSSTSLTEHFSDGQLGEDEANTLRLRSRARSTASVFVPEARDMDGNGLPDSAPSIAESSPNSSDLDFVHDSFEDSAPNQAALQFRQQERDNKAPSAAPAIRSFSKSETITALQGYCSRGHLLNRRALVKKGKSQQCSFCSREFVYDIFSCYCYTEYACLRCLTHHLAHPPPPRCSLTSCLGACRLRFKGCSLLCFCCKVTIAGNTLCWQCANHGCKFVMCVNCNKPTNRGIPPSDASIHPPATLNDSPIKQRSRSVEGSTSPRTLRSVSRRRDASLPATVLDTPHISQSCPPSSSQILAPSSLRANATNSTDSSGTPAPMPADRA
jgi:hypothetical protein